MLVFMCAASVLSHVYRPFSKPVVRAGSAGTRMPVDPWLFLLTLIGRFQWGPK